jgi:hypothetical protein
MARSTGDLEWVLNALNDALAGILNRPLRTVRIRLISSVDESHT